MKQRNFAGDYTQVQERAFLPTGGIPSKLNKNKHVLVYLWTVLKHNIVCANALDANHNGWNDVGYMWEGKKPQQEFFTFQ